MYFLNMLSRSVWAFVKGRGLKNVKFLEATCSFFSYCCDYNFITNKFTCEVPALTGGVKGVGDRRVLGYWSCRVC